MIRKLLRNGSLMLNLIAIALLLLSASACYINPEKIWWIAIIGMAFPLFLLLNFLFAIFWLMAKPLFIIFPIIGFALCWGQIKTLISFAETEKSIPEKTIKIMSYNVKSFDLYNWTKNKETRRNIFNLIKEENADIISFQEFYSDEGDFKNEKYLLDSCGYKYSSFSKTYSKVYTKKKKSINLHWGTAIFSKYPIVNTGKIVFPDVMSNHCQWADVKVNEQTVRVYNTHLQSIHLGYEDYNAIEEIEQNQKTSSVKIKRILSKVKLAYTKRADQVELIKTSMAESPYPIILCGDFNDQPISYSYTKLSENMQDAFLERGNGIGGTFANSFNFFRIDFLLFAKKFKIYDYKSVKKKYSDHYPVIATFGIIN
jgi:endonuclease/exonuclease/phosphatase family metal-dependent hydrolase